MTTEPIPAIDLAAETLTSDVTNTIIGWFKAQTKPYGLMSYDEQASLVAGASKLSQQTIHNAVQIIAADGRKTIAAKIEKVEFGQNGLKATLTASKSSEFRHDLADAQGLFVLVVVADASEFTGGELIEPDAPKDDQKTLFDKEDKPVFDNTASGKE